MKQVKAADKQKYAQETAIRFTGDKSSEEGKGKTYPRASLDSQGQASSNETDYSNAGSSKVPFTDLVAAVVSSGGSSRVCTICLAGLCASRHPLKFLLWRVYRYMSQDLLFPDMVLTCLYARVLASSTCGCWICMKSCH